MDTRTRLTPPQVAKILGVNRDKVLSWIHSGELRAYSVSSAGQRPRYRVIPADLEAFENRRAAEQFQEPPVRRRRAQARIGDVVKFY